MTTQPTLRKRYPLWKLRVDRRTINVSLVVYLAAPLHILIITSRKQKELAIRTVWNAVQRQLCPFPHATYNELLPEGCSCKKIVLVQL